MALKRERQSGLKIEGTEGTREVLGAADFSGNPSGCEYTYHGSEYERSLDIGTMSKLPNLRGPHWLTHKRTMEAAGGSASAHAPWVDQLRACGFAVAALKVVSLTGAPSGGTFKYGDVIGDNATFGSLTKKGVFIKYLAGSPNKLVLLPVTGTFADGDTIYNYAISQVSATQVGAAANAGFHLTPLSERSGVVPPSATLELREAGVAHTSVGARGTCSMEIAHTKPLLFQAEFSGPCKLTSGSPPTIAAMTGIPAVNVPGVCGEGGVGVGVPFLMDAFGPIATQFKIDIGNTVTQRATLGTSTEASGYLPSRITDRKVTFSTDPEQPVAGDFDLINKMLAGTPMEFYTEVGKASGASGLIIVHGPAVQFTGDYTPGDRDGIVTANVSGMFTGTPAGDDEISIDHVFVA